VCSPRMCCGNVEWWCSQDLTAPEAPDASIHFGTTTNLVRLWHTGETARALDQGLAPAQAFPVKEEALPLQCL